jgi:DNA/RNA-binding domain of Phe-tRNA-synthetase-like protein
MPVGRWRGGWYINENYNIIGERNMDMLIMAPKIFEKIPDLVLIVGEMEVGEPNKDQIADYLSRSWDKLTEEVAAQGYKTHPMIAPWREALVRAQIPVRQFPPSIEFLAKLTKGRSEPLRINPIVDTYNAISMDLVLPLGAFDLDQLDGHVHLRLSAGDESFCVLGSKEQEQTALGEIVYADDNDILTRQFIWKQAEKGKILPTTTRVIFFCELLGGMGEEMVAQAKETIGTQFEALLGGVVADITVIKA